MTPKPDDFEALLGRSASHATPGLQDSLRQQTTKQVRIRRWLRRSRLVIALAGCYLAGLATIHWLRPRPAPERIVVEVVRIVPEVKPTAPAWPEPLRQLELRAEQAEKTEQAQVFFAAAKRYATETGDWDSALRCYRNGLDADPKQAERIDPDNDDWLAMALKLDRQKEKDYAIDRK
jgi:hypothetical protein